MRRLIPVLIAILIGSSIPLFAQDCCEQEAAGQCNQSNAPKGKMPCGRSLSICPDSACLMQQKAAISPSVQLDWLGRQALVVSSVPFDVRPVLQERSPGSPTRPQIALDGSLFLRNHSFLI
jgi:hypothetical protein